MKLIEIHNESGGLGLLQKVLESRQKEPGPISELPAVTLVRSRVAVDGEQVAQYAAACGFQAEQGVPLIYPQMLTFPLVLEYMVSPECPWPALGTVHLANRIQQHQALRPGDEVRVELTTGELFAHPRGQGFNLELRVFRDEVLVWNATQSLFRLGIKPASGAAFVSEEPADKTTLSRQADIIASSVISRRYASVSGDWNPIHLSGLTAKLFGFRQAIAHGMWSKARALACILPMYPLEQAEVMVEFRSPLFLPATASLWTAYDKHRTAFEVRDGKGRRTHLRGRLDY